MWGRVTSWGGTGVGGVRSGPSAGIPFHFLCSPWVLCSLPHYSTYTPLHTHRTQVYVNKQQTFKMSIFRIKTLFVTTLFTAIALFLKAENLLMTCRDLPHGWNLDSMQTCHRDQDQVVLLGSDSDYVYMARKKKKKKKKKTEFSQAIILNKTIF